MGTTGATERDAIATAASRPHPLHGLILADHLPEALRTDLVPALESLVRQVQLQGLWLFGSWARGTPSRRSDVDLPLQPLVVRREVLVRHSDTPFWRAVRAEAVPLLSGSRFP